MSDCAARILTRIADEQRANITAQYQAREVEFMRLTGEDPATTNVRVLHRIEACWKTFDPHADQFGNGCATQCI